MLLRKHAAWRYAFVRATKWWPRGQCEVAAEGWMARVSKQTESLLYLRCTWKANRQTATAITTTAFVPGHPPANRDPGNQCCAERPLDIQIPLGREQTAVYGLGMIRDQCDGQAQLEVTQVSRWPDHDCMMSWQSGPLFFGHRTSLHRLFAVFINSLFKYNRLKSSDFDCNNKFNKIAWIYSMFSCNHLLIKNIIIYEVMFYSVLPSENFCL